MVLFGKRQDQGFTPNNVPYDRAMNLQNQGMSSNKIFQSLQREGYAPDQISDAIYQSDIKAGVNSMPVQEYEQRRAQRMPEPYQGSERVEEIAEAIIDEKWRELSRSFDKIIEWKDKTESRLTALEQEFQDLKKGFDSLHTAILGKVSEYDQNIVNLGAEIKAMEKVFQKIIPTFTENVNELSRITRGLKKG